MPAKPALAILICMLDVVHISNLHDITQPTAESKSDSEDDADKEDKQDDGLSDSIRDFLAHNGTLMLIFFGRY